MTEASTGGGFWDTVTDMAEESGRIEDIAFDADGIERVITRLEDFKVDYLMKIQREMRGLEQIQEPQDYVSANVVSDIKTWKSNSDEFTDRYIDRVDKLIDNLKAAKADYLGREEGIGGSVAGIAKSLDA